jgi:ligand-binding SRPBCC domain-containing protein
MTKHTFQAELWLPEKRDAVFSFFADAHNLEAITPPWLNFRIVTPEPIDMHSGARIDYQLRVHGFPVRWKTEISAWEPPFRFVDNQLSGPYRKWIHTHIFEEKDGGTLCRDHVEYAVLGGHFINWLIVRRDVEKIFAYRQEAMSARFRAWSASHSNPLPVRSLKHSEGFNEPSSSNNL